ncbi:MAG: hypothetical protein IPN16_24530, partial [Gemmatimonadetes bacterium]|nr:hypothetical protein [Gemmatimonadota bacterium]
MLDSAESEEDEMVLGRLRKRVQIEGSLLDRRRDAAMLPPPLGIDEMVIENDQGYARRPKDIEYVRQCAQASVMLGQPAGMSRSDVDAQIVCTYEGVLYAGHGRP